jgi:tubulin polyglutamylase TTLL7
MFAPVNG